MGRLGAGGPKGQAAPSLLMDNLQPAPGVLPSFRGGILLPLLSSKSKTKQEPDSIA